MSENPGYHAGQTDQLVVAIAHVELVTAQLRAGNVFPTQVDKDADLGLALFDLDIAEVERAAPAEPADRPALDRLLNGLYKAFAATYGGWHPLFGKNRLVEPIVAEHTIGGGDQGVPTLAGPTSSLPPATRRTGIRVGIADTAVALCQPLFGRFVGDPEALGVAGAAPLPAAAGHATFVAGLVLTEAPGATLEVARVLGDNGLGDSWTLAKEIVRFGRNGIDILNLSLGCFTEDNLPPFVLSTAVDRVSQRVLVVAAAGKDDTTTDPRPLWPAAFDYVVGVGATGRDAAGRLPVWSPDPDGNPWVDVLAWGDKVQSTYLTGPVQGGNPVTTLLAGKPFSGFATWSGTSFAAARVTGKIADRAAARGISAVAAYRELVATADIVSGRPWLG